MCQVLPYTLPCCRRIYVEVTKLPSCPDAWPEKKCPPELCIQVRGFETEDRVTGTCWRCQAEIAGIFGEEWERLRPGIDSAMIVHGLDELGVSGRRRMVEEGGNCWYCRARAGCEYCGAATKVEAGTREERPENSEKKRRRDTSGRKEIATNKRIKVEPRDYNQPRTPALSYPDPEISSQWQNVSSTSYNSMPFPRGYGFTPGSSMTGFGLPWSQPFSSQPDLPESASVDWAAVHNEQNNAQINFGNGAGQNYLTEAPFRGPQGKPFFNNEPYQSLYPPDPGPAPDVKPAPQPEINFENPTQMADGTLVQLLDTYNNQNTNFGHDSGQHASQLPSSCLSVDQEETHCRPHTKKFEQLVPGT